MSSNLRDTTTVSEWLARLPVHEEISDQAQARTEEEKLADLKWHMELLAGADHARLCCMLIYLIQVLRARDEAGALYLLQQLHERIITDSFERTVRNLFN